VLGSARRPGLRSRRKREGAGSVAARPASPALTANTPSISLGLSTRLAGDGPPRGSASTAAQAAFFTRLLPDCLSRLSRAVSPLAPSVEVDGEGGQKAFLSAENGCQPGPSQSQSAGDTSKSLILLNNRCGAPSADTQRPHITGLRLKTTAQSRSRGRSPNTLSHSPKSEVGGHNDQGALDLPR
jgi:hypothetical protein